MQQMEYLGPGGDTTLFMKDGDRLWLRRLCGSPCGNYGEDTGPAATQGPALLVTSLGRFEGDHFKPVETAFDAHAARIVWSAGGGALRLESQWSFCPQTGVVSRKDRLLNAGNEPVTVFRCKRGSLFRPAATRSMRRRAVGATRTRGHGSRCTPAACASAACPAG